MADKKTGKAADEDPAEALVRRMPALRRDDAVVWLCRTFGFDPTLLESARSKGWVEFNAAAGLWAGAPAVGQAGGSGGDGGVLPFVPAAAAAAFDDPGGFKLV